MEKKQNVPALRFRGFSSEWNDFTLEKCTNRFDNLRVPISASQRIAGSTPYYGANGIQDYVHGYTHKGEYILIAEDGANDVNNYPIHYVNGEVWVNNHAHVLQGKDGIANTKFLKYALSKMDFRSHLVGGSRAKLNANIMMAMEVKLPLNASEQKLLGEFLDDVDGEILLRQHKIQKLQQFRQAMLTKLFPREGAAEPELRFRGFSGKWKLCRLSDFVKEITRVDASSKAPVMMVTAANGFINQSERYSFDNSGQSLQKYILLKQGELAYNHGASKLRPFGSCFVLQEKEARVPFVYHCFAVVDSYADFVALELNDNLVARQLRRIVSSGARMDGLLNISFAEYCTVKIALPCRDEQRKIGKFFRELDTYISLQQKKLERMQRLKAALLGKMFV